MEDENEVSVYTALDGDDKPCVTVVFGMGDEDFVAVLTAQDASELAENLIGAAMDIQGGGSA